jgi:Tol biopolymer transport system component
MDCEQPALSGLTHLGPYEIVGLVGAGGMGEVYRAWDPRLERAVAIKVLPGNFSTDRDRLARFAQEARIAGSLNHPNILSVHDVGGVGSVPYIVFDLLQGETLRLQIRRGLRPRTAIDIAIQLASGLCKVHEAGIVHRDLKPENIFVTTERVVKILDFGLAQPSLSATTDNCDALTADDCGSAGSASGTAGYASPEQLNGLAADHRSDLFAFGAILFEMLTGVRAFSGATRAEALGSVLNDDPFDTVEAAKRLPAWQQRLIGHCLEKDPSLRFQSARDLLFALCASETPAEPSAAQEKPTTLRRFGLGAATLAVIALSTTWNPIRSTPSGDPVTTRAAMALGPGIDYAGEGLAVSGDGTVIVFSGVSEGRRHLYIRRAHEFTVQRLPETERATGPFFSPDGRWIGFFADRKLKKMALAGSPPVVLCDAPENRGASWGIDDTILFTPSLSAGVWRVSAAGGEAIPVTKPDPAKGEKSHRFPEWLPDGKGVLFHTHYSDISSLDDARIEALRLDTGERHVLVQGGQDAVYRRGFVFYLRGNVLMAVPFNTDRLTVAGAPRTVERGLLPSQWGTRHFGLGENGSLVYVPEHEQVIGRMLAWVDRKGKVDLIGGMSGDFREVRLSPDGGKLIARVAAANDQLWMYEFTRKVWTRLTYQWDSVSAIWTPDSQRITLASSRTGRWNLFWMPADTGASMSRLLHSGHWQRPTSWSPDSSTLAFTESDPTTRDDIWTWQFDQSPRVFLRTQFGEGEARFSPNGKWIAYSSNETGQQEVYVRPYPSGANQWRISSDGGQSPAWGASGNELFYRTPAASREPLRLMSVRVDTDSSFNASAPSPLFDAQAFGPYDVAADGRRFVMITNPRQRLSELRIVTNWFAEISNVIPE